MDLTGTWKGFYQYGDGYELPMFAQKVNFTLKITSFENNEFKGFTIEEESDFYVPEKGIVSGFIQDNLMSFVKKYPKSYHFKPDSTELEISDKEQNIEHTGRIDSKRETIYGMWFISETIFENFQHIDITSEGIWVLKKQ